MLGKNVLGVKAPPQSGPRDAGAQVRRIVDFVRDFSIETTPVSSREIASFGAHLRRGTTVYVVSPPGRRLGDIIETARGLHRFGFRPVPHIAARSIADRDCLANFLQQITSQAGVDQVLVVGGSRVKPVGDFHCALQIIETGLLDKFGIRRIGVAGHPEGHPVVPREEIMESLRQKVAYGRRVGAEIHVVTQFCFDPDLVVDWEKDIRATVGDIPVHVGIPGPASLTSLVKYARICNIGESVRFLTRGASAALKLVNWSPDYFLTALVNHKAVDPDCGITKAHFYSFGDVTGTARWLAAARDSVIAMHRDGRGFAVADDVVARE